MFKYIAVLLLLISCTADYSKQGALYFEDEVVEGVWECKSPVVDRVFYFDSRSTDFQLISNWPVPSESYIRFTDLETGEEVILREDSLNYKCEFIGEIERQRTAPEEKK